MVEPPYPSPNPQTRRCFGGSPAAELVAFLSLGVPPRPPESKEEGNPPKLKCELCGRVDFAYKFKRSKRFCSMACAKRYNVGCTKRVGLFHPDRSKLQKPGGPPHGRRRTCKGTLPALSKDAKKQVRGGGRAGAVPKFVVRCTGGL